MKGRSSLILWSNMSARLPSWIFVSTQSLKKSLRLNLLGDKIDFSIKKNKVKFSREVSLGNGGTVGFVGDIFCDKIYFFIKKLSEIW